MTNRYKLENEKLALSIPFGICKKLKHRGVPILINFTINLLSW
jgi:hypothetical protein